MPDEHYIIRDGKNQAVQVRLRRDRRLKRTIRWEHLPDKSLLVRVPVRMPKRNIAPLLDQIRQHLENSTEIRRQRNDAELQDRAELINQKYFGGKLQWNAIRWVGNMRRRLGSCTQGGPTDGEIRISRKIKSWPAWIVDYVIAHELMHRKFPNHSAEFWKELIAAYPLAEKARGFVEGAFFITDQILDDELED